MLFKNALDISHKLVKKALTEGDIAVDATAGNGNDTLFLSRLVGPEGKVYAFDIQDQAIKNTHNRLIKNKMRKNVQLIKDSHENISKYVPSNISVIMFNLGYLPGGDHSVSTNHRSTIAAIDASLELLKIAGIIMLVIYYGGDSGFDEKDAVIKHIKTIDNRKYSVLMMDYVNQINCPPIAVLIERII